MSAVVCSDGHVYLAFMVKRPFSSDLYTPCIHLGSLTLKLAN